ncbi:hypothetical protein AZ46_0217805 [Metabacillus indicus LMG 22858]|nr:hypothetical protein AZ46_0217805 [Metabacillus indicus LMG 22858]
MDNQQPSSWEETLEKVQRLEKTVYGASYDYESRRAVQTVRSAQPLNDQGEDIVYSMTERHSGKASQPTTTRCSSITSLIGSKTLAQLGSFLLAIFLQNCKTFKPNFNSPNLQISPIPPI